MNKKQKIDSKEAGLEIAFHFFKFFLKSEYLHYGFFSEGLETDILNLSKAQTNYSELLISNIPVGTKTILDVGCGSGKMAETLLNLGYFVDCVSPGHLLTKYVKESIGSRIELFESKFENINTEKKYDLIIFSESFQYIDINTALKKSMTLLNPNSYIIISDFFQKNTDGKSPIGGGHNFDEWIRILKKYPFTVQIDKDITPKVSPTIDLVNQISMEVIYPIWKVIFQLFEDRFPLILKFLKWKYKKKLNKLNNKHFIGERTGENFQKFKKYVFYLLKSNLLY
jgi:ubiquinone/menaquinone biosynthesis C-methylase UbiE